MVEFVRPAPSLLWRSRSGGKSSKEPVIDTERVPRDQNSLVFPFLQLPVARVAHVGVIVVFLPGIAARFLVETFKLPLRRRRLFCFGFVMHEWISFRWESDRGRGA